jgi:branched-chain amino acid transport system substrate-binding protein
LTPAAVRRAASIVALSVVALAGCGDGVDEPSRVHGDTLTVYASLPAHGTEAAAGAAVAAGMRRALAETDGRVNGRKVRLVVLPSTRPEDETWDPGTVEANADRAAEDPTTIAYVGELDRGGSAVSLPVTNRAGILQVSPADGLTSYTRTPPGRPRAGPERYYPDGRRTFVRLVRPDLDAARAIVSSLHARGARRLAVVHEDGIADRELEAMVLALIGTRPPREVLRTAAGDGEPDDVAELTDEVIAAQPDALLYAGPAGPAARSVLGALAARVPGLPVYGGPQLARTTALAGVPDETCAFTGVPRPRALPPHGRDLLARLRQATPRHPGTDALLGYESMRLTLDAIRVAGADRRAVARAARTVGRRNSALGAYVVTRGGDVEGPTVACVDPAAPEAASVELRR